MDNWAEIRQWRYAKRAELVAERLSVSAAHRRRVRSRIGGRLRELAAHIQGTSIAFYWPIRGEVDVRNVVGEFAENGAVAALPVVVAKHRPVEFWHWRPGMKMNSGVWNIPIPGERRVLHPKVVLVPLIGFDDAGYRLGYGGGYYDRSLAAMRPKPLAIGVGYEAGRMPSIHAQPHDIPMDVIVTEAGIRWIATQYQRSGVGEQSSAAARPSPTPATEQSIS